MGMSNVCNRCGKQRILVKTWTEEVITANGTSELTYTQYACPDESCQKIVDEELQAKQDAHHEREMLAKKREEARLAQRTLSLKKAREKAQV